MPLTDRVMHKNGSFQYLLMVLSLRPSQIDPPRPEIQQAKEDTNVSFFFSKGKFTQKHKLSDTAV